MRVETPFHIESREERPKPSKPSNTETVLPIYIQALHRIILHIQATPHDGILTFGFSARDMWLDIQEVAGKERIQISDYRNITGQPSWNLYTGQLPSASGQWKELGIPYESPLIVEDYSDNGRKTVDLNILFQGLQLPVAYAFLYAKEVAKKN